MEEDINGLLDDWRVEIASDGYAVLVGKITGDTKGRFTDGTVMHTSRITTSDPIREGAVVQTLNSKYKLGKPRDLRPKEARFVLPCGHEDSFEHRFANGLITIVSAGMEAKVDPTEAMMSYIRQVFEAFCIQIPDMAQIIAVANSMGNEKKEVH